ncbi:MAG: nuclear transport factor 2 family protein [Pseudomonadota bacterium]
MSADIEALKRMYTEFNDRNIDGVLAALSDDVVWANGMDGGYEHGGEAVRAYWKRQWEIVSPRIEPVSFEPAPNATIVVKVKQSVFDLEGNPLQDQAHGLKDSIIEHVFTFRNGRVTRFDIREAG